MKRTRYAACAVAVMSALPAAAQDLSTSTSLLTHFATRCGQIAADPTIAVSGIAGASARIAGDRSLITHKEPAGPTAEIAFRQMQFADGKTSDCALTMTGFGVAQYDDLGTLIAQNGAALFGTPVTVYGNNTPGNTVQMIATPGYPPAASLTQVQTRDRLELVLSLSSSASPAPTPGPTPAPQPLEITPAPSVAPETPALTLAPASPAQLTEMDLIAKGLTACLSAADNPAALAPALQNAGFAFARMDGDTDIILINQSVIARLSAEPQSGFCTLIAEDLPLTYGAQAGQQAAGDALATKLNGCDALNMQAGPVTMTFLNPGHQTACNGPQGTAISLVLQ